MVASHRLRELPSGPPPVWGVRRVRRSPLCGMQRSVQTVSGMRGYGQGGLIALLPAFIPRFLIVGAGVLLFASANAIIRSNE